MLYQYWKKNRRYKSLASSVRMPPNGKLHEETLLDRNKRQGNALSLPSGRERIRKPPFGKLHDEKLLDRNKREENAFHPPMGG